MLKRLGWVTIIPMILLCILGLFTLLSTTIGLDGQIALEEIVVKQIIFIAIGFVLFFIVSFLDISYLRHPQLWGILYVITIILLVVTAFWAPVINGVQRWLIIGGVQIQPSEIAKIMVIIMTASVISSRDKIGEWKAFFLSFALLLPILFLVFIEPHGSMTIMIFGIWFLMVFIFMHHQFRNFLLLLVIATIAIGGLMLSLSQFILAGLLIAAGVVIGIFGIYWKEEWRKLFLIALVIGGIMGAVSAVSWQFVLRDYQKDRIETYLNEGANATEQDFNVIQSKVAIGSGGLFGKGFGYGTQSRLKFLPEHQTDFIFATYAEQFGLVGSIFLLSLYGILIAWIFIVGYKVHENTFFSMIVIGIGLKFVIEIFINIGTNTGVIPATGIPLPLMSAGGSSILLTFIALGLVQSVIRHYQKELITPGMVDNEDLLI